MLEALTVKENYSLDQTIAKDIFNGVTYPWEVLPKISSFILELGATLSEDEYEKRGENVWVAKSAKVAPTAFINGPAIIGKDAEVAAIFNQAHSNACNRSFQRYACIKQGHGASADGSLGR